MANRQLLRFLEQGIDLWNGYRRQHLQSERPDLTRAKLSMADLRGADLSFTDLTEADLRGANLSHVNLIGSDLSGSNLAGADLSRASLLAADLSLADLRGANLEETKLDGARLIGADLRGASLERASLAEADFEWANLDEHATVFKATGTRNLFANPPDMKFIDCGELAIEYSGRPPDAFTLGILHINLQQILDKVVSICLQVPFLFGRPEDPTMKPSSLIRFRPSDEGFDRLWTVTGPVVQAEASYVKVGSLTEIFHLGLNILATNADVRAVAQNIAATIIWSIGRASLDRLSDKVEVSTKGRTDLGYNVYPEIGENIRTVITSLIRNNHGEPFELKIESTSPTGERTVVKMKSHGSGY